jgi:hypothetical protein
MVEECIVSGDPADVAAGLLAAEKRNFSESQAKFQENFEAREAKFNAGLEAMAPRKPEGQAKSESAGTWILARKCWAWMCHD